MNILPFMFLLAIYLMTPSLSVAQCTGPQDPPDGHVDIGIFFDEGATTTCLSATTMDPFTFYVVSGPGDVGGLQGFDLQVGVDPRLQVVSRTLNSPLWTDFDPRPDNWAVSLGLTCPADPLNALVTYEVFLSDPTQRDVIVCLLPYDGPSADPVRGLGYATCSNVNGGFVPAYQGCAVINPLNLEVPIPAKSKSWGAVKSIYN